MPIALAWEMLAGMPERRRALAGPLGLAIVGTVARVGGVGSAAGFLGHVLTPLILTHIIEWMPPDPRTWRGVFVFGWLFGVWSSVWPVLRRQHDWVSQGWLIGGTGAALFAQRFVPYMAIGTLMLLMTHVPPSRSGARGWRTGMLVALTTPVLGLMALTIRQSGVFRPAWPASALTFLQKHHATNIVSRSGDTLTGAGLIPWVNGQIQLVSDAPWLPLWLDTIQGTVEPAQFVARADPTSRWIVWPLDRAPGLPVRMPSSWRMVWRGDIRWNGGFQKIPSAIWERVAPDACLQCNRHGLAVCSGCRVSSVSHLHATGWDTLYPIPVPSSTPCGFPMNTADGHSYSEVLHSTHGSHP
ncbi:hypothetical protein [Sulfobacillus thermotolerans]|uniref:hypothetical protein n=1 Tax=Sulfobacillus thermotolerans TaxID=338644 RepID=UPI0033681341